MRLVLVFIEENVMPVTETSDWNNFTENCRGLLISDQDGDEQKIRPTTTKKNDPSQRENTAVESGTSTSQS
jgi:hypothetical protein